ncbi:MAG: translation initiation factor IF-2 N-terminal domain-containing protein, partial [Bacteroidales bacterium]
PTPTTSFNIVGKIDLDAINQKTRPQKKSKEERQKERDEKDKQRSEMFKRPVGIISTPEGERKKRKRIQKDKIDITTPVVPSGDNRPRFTKPQPKGRPLRPVKAAVSEVDVQKQIKETLARLTSKGAAQKKSARWRKEKRDAFTVREQELAEQERLDSKVLKITEFVTANDLAVMMGVEVNKIISTCMSIGMMVSINQRLDAETINIVAEEFSYKTEYVSADVVSSIEHSDEEGDVIPRPPIVTVMGHVDHGKTSLLDYIRSANVIAGEAGGITQHIGAYNVKLEDGRRITFLDTPGHEAFTAMRARGAKVTDIAIIIVAADDNVMPQTVEAINHASAAGVPIVFAINKVDKPNANPEKIKEELANMNYLVEDWGGKYQSQDISAKKGTGVLELMEKVLLEAEILD